MEYEDKPGHLWHMRYPLVLSGSGYLVVATTRPETMMGDTGVAVNPNDERYQHLVGKTCLLPLMDREIPIVADEYVEMDFGTGCVKMTPAHDPNDFEVGLRHNLDTIRVLDDNGVVNANGGKYQGMDRYEARKAVVADLEALGLLEKVEDYSAQRGHLLPLPQRRGAHHLRPVVREDGPPGQGGPAGGGRRGDQVCPRPLLQDLSQLDGERPRLVHLPAAVVGPPDSRVVLRRLRPHDRLPGPIPPSARSAARHHIQSGP